MLFIFPLTLTTKLCYVTNLNKMAVISKTLMDFFERKKSCLFLPQLPLYAMLKLKMLDLKNRCFFATDKNKVLPPPFFQR